VIKAFIANDFLFIHANGQVITELSDESIEVINRARITWRIQKNCQNNQTITLPCDKTNPAICPILAALRLVLRACRLSQPDSMPVACYLKKGAMASITGSKIAVHFQAAAKAVHPNISKDDEQRFSVHSMRVWACVLLDEAGKSPDYIKKCLRWMGDSFRMYLRDTHVIQDQHREALRLAGNVADMSRHVADDTPCRSNFGQMGPCRRHNFFGVVAICVGSSRHLLDFSEFVCRNILWWYGGTYAQILRTHMHSTLSFHVRLLPPRSFFD